MIEAMVAISILSVIMAGMFVLLLFGSRSLRLTGTGDIQLELDRSMRTIRDELLQATYADVALPTSACIVGSPYGLRTDPDRTVYLYDNQRLRYRTWVAFFGQGRELRRAERSMGSGIFYAFSLPLGTRPAPASLGSLPSVILSKNLDSFVVTVNPIAQATLVVSLKLGAQANSTKRTELEYKTSVLLRNR